MASNQAGFGQVAGESDGSRAALRELPSSTRDCGSYVQPVCGDIERFAGDHIRLRSGVAIAADLVLYATGYNKSYEYLDPGLRVGQEMLHVAGIVQELSWWYNLRPVFSPVILCAHQLTLTIPTLATVSCSKLPFLCSSLEGLLI